LDFYHPTEYLGELGRALYPSEESTRKEWIEQWCHPTPLTLFREANKKS
jgi:hypothetical protein